MTMVFSTPRPRWADIVDSSQEASQDVMGSLREFPLPSPPLTDSYEQPFGDSQDRGALCELVASAALSPEKLSKPEATSDVQMSSQSASSEAGDSVPRLMRSKRFTDDVLSAASTQDQHIEEAPPAPVARPLSAILTSAASNLGIDVASSSLPSPQSKNAARQKRFALQAAANQVKRHRGHGRSSSSAASAEASSGQPASASGSISRSQPTAASASSSSSSSFTQASASGSVSRIQPTATSASSSNSSSSTQAPMPPPAQNGGGVTEQERRQKRRAIVRIHKARPLYQAFNALRPRHTRFPGEPMTPDTEARMSKRQ